MDEEDELTSEATASDASMRECTMGKDVPLSLATFSSVTTRSYAIIFVCMWRERLGLTEDYNISDFSHELNARSYCQSTFSNRTPSHFGQCTVSASNTTAEFFEDAFFLCFPITLTAFFQDAIELFLSLPPSFFYG